MSSTLSRPRAPKHRIWLTAVASFAAGLALAAAGAGQATSVAGLEFAGARLGMSQANWKASPPPGKISANTRALCSDDPDAARPVPTAAERRAGVVVCAYADAYGKLSLPVRFALDKRYTLDHLRFWFAGGRLTEIHADASLGAYNALVADFTTRYGPSTRLVRDGVPSELGRLPRVTQDWSAPGGWVELVDPVLPSDEIGLRLATGPAGPETRRSIVRTP